MSSTEPGDRRRLERPPSERYAAPRPDGARGSEAPEGAARALGGPLLRAAVAAIVGAAALVLVGAVLASTFGLLFVAAGMGAAIGLLLARAAVPDDGSSPVSRRVVIGWAVGITVVATAVAEAGIWLYGRAEGGTLDLLDYLWTTFGLFVPGVAIVAAVAAWWGATSGPVQR